VPDVEQAELNARCIGLVDGDTLKARVVDGPQAGSHGHETVRLLGIDTPETGYPFASDAKWFLHSLVARCNIRLEIGDPARDAYDRLLAHVYVETEDGWVNVNAEIVRAGLADLLFIPPNMRYYGYFQDLLEEAQIERRGMWGAIEGAITVQELEADLVGCVTEVVTVVITIDSIEETRRGFEMLAADSAYGFHVLIPEDSDAAVAFEPLDALIGQTVTVTGTVECNVRCGPWLQVTSPAQLRIESGANEPPATAPETP